MGGCVMAKGWVEIHNPSSPSLSVKMFSMGSCACKTNKDDEYPDMEDLTEFKSAIRVLRGAMSYVHPWNRSIDALESFFVQNNYCNKDLAGLERHVQLLTQFSDYVLGENACRWRGMEPFLNTRDLRGTWADFLGQKSGAFKQKSSGSQQNSNSNSNKFQQNSNKFQQNKQNNNNGMAWGGTKWMPKYMFEDDICVMWNLGRCIKPPGACTNRRGVALRHVCNHRPDPSKTTVICGKSHMASLFHK